VSDREVKKTRSPSVEEKRDQANETNLIVPPPSFDLSRLCVLPTSSESKVVAAPLRSSSGIEGSKDFQVVPKETKSALILFQTTKPIKRDSSYSPTSVIL